MLQGVHYEYYSPKMLAIAPGSERYAEKKFAYKSTGHSAQSASIARRNARERNRVKQVNDGFNALRKRLPASVIAALSGGSRRGSGKKLSKVDTLKMVVEYIKHLQRLINDSDAALGVTKVHYDNSMFGGSPYTEPMPSPSGSECSSGVSSANSSYQSYPEHAMDEDDLLDAISWWQQK